jgi:hypothetical protein
MKNKIIEFKIDILNNWDKEKDKMKFSLNKIWWGWPWSQWLRKDKRDMWHEVIDEVIDEYKLKKINYPIEIEFIFYWKSRYLDCSNCTPMVKLIEDWLVENKILTDDTNEYIRRIHIESILLNKKDRNNIEEDYVLVKLIPYEKN